MPDYIDTPPALDPTAAATWACEGDLDVDPSERIDAPLTPMPVRRARAAELAARERRLRRRAHTLGLAVRTARDDITNECTWTVWALQAAAEDLDELESYLDAEEARGD